MKHKRKKHGRKVSKTQINAIIKSASKSMKAAIHKALRK